MLCLQEISEKPDRHCQRAQSHPISDLPRLRSKPQLHSRNNINILPLSLSCNTFSQFIRSSFNASTRWDSSHYDLDSLMRKSLSYASPVLYPREETPRKSKFVKAEEAMGEDYRVFLRTLRMREDVEVRLGTYGSFYTVISIPSARCVLCSSTIVFSNNCILVFDDAPDVLKSRVVSEELVSTEVSTKLMINERRV